MKFEMKKLIGKSILAIAICSSFSAFAIEPFDRTVLVCPTDEDCSTQFKLKVIESINTGTKLYLPSGNYTLSEAIEISPDMEVTGLAAKVESGKVMNLTIIGDNSNTSVVHLKRLVIKDTASLTIQDLAFDGQNMQQDITDSNLVYIDKVENLSIDNSRFSNADLSLLTIHDANQFSVLNNTIENSGMSETSLPGGIYGDVRQGTGLTISNSRNGQIKGNTIRKTFQSGMYVFQNNSNNSECGVSTNIAVLDNTVTGALDNGIRLQADWDLDANGNRLCSNEQFADITVKDNIITNIQSSGIRLNGHNIKAIGNTIIGAGGPTGFSTQLEFDNYHGIKSDGITSSMRSAKSIDANPYNPTGLYNGEYDGVSFIGANNVIDMVSGITLEASFTDIDSVRVQSNLIQGAQVSGIHLTANPHNLTIFDQPKQVRHNLISQNTVNMRPTDILVDGKVIGQVGISIGGKVLGEGAFDNIVSDNVIRMSSTVTNRFMPFKAAQANATAFIFNCSENNSTDGRISVTEVEGLSIYGNTLINPTQTYNIIIDGTIKPQNVDKCSNGLYIQGNKHDNNFKPGYGFMTVGYACPQYSGHGNNTGDETVQSCRLLATEPQQY